MPSVSLPSANAPFFKWEIKEKIIENLYTAPGSELQKELYDLVKKNQRLVGISGESYIYYRNKKYYSKDLEFGDNLMGDNVTYKHADMSPSIKDPLIILIDEYEELRSERLLIESYLNRILNFSNTDADMKKLLPSSAHRFINSVDAPHLQTITPDDVAKYRRETYKYAIMLNERIIINLISTR